MSRFLALLLLLAFATPSAAELSEATPGAFVVRQEAVVPLDCDKAYDLMTGDISPWWDHSVSESPAHFFIEARPGGGFYEYFDEEGQNGVLHATVIFAQRGKRLTYRGPLGFNGKAFDLIVTYTYEAVEAGTLVKVECRGIGEMEAGWAEAVDGVWRHFLIERFVPFAEGQ